MSEREGWVISKEKQDPIIEMIKNHVCSKCGEKRLLCDCWIEKIHCEICKNQMVACVCLGDENEKKK